jgi:hypothetical protein
MGGTRGTRPERNIGVLMGKPERKRLLGRPKCRWEDNIKIDIKSVSRASTALMWLGIG